MDSDGNRRRKDLILPAIHRIAARATSRIHSASATRLSLALAGVSFVVLVIFNRGTWFTGDDFALLTGRFFEFRDGQWVDALLRPHNEHPSVPIVAVYYILQETVGLHHPILFSIPMMLSHALVVFCLSRFMITHFASRWMALAGGASLVFLSAGWENLLWAFQFGFVGAVAFGLVHLLILFEGPQTPRRLAGAAVAGVLAVMSTSHGLVFVAVGAAYLALERRWKTLVVACAAPMGVWALWYAAYGSSETHVEATWRQRLQLPEYLWRGLRASIDGLLQVEGISAAVLVAIIVLGMKHYSKAVAWSFPIALSGAAVLFYLLTGFGRLNFGIDQAAASRYTYVGAVLLAPMIFTVMDAAAASIRKASVLAGAVALWLALSGLAEFRSMALQQHGDESRRLRIMSSAAALAIEEPDLVDLDASPSPLFEPGLTVRKIKQLVELGIWPEGHVDRNGRILAALEVSLRLAPSTGSDLTNTWPSTAHVAHLFNGYVTEASGGCATIAPRPGARIIVEPVGDNPVGLSVDFVTRARVSLGNADLSFMSPSREFLVEAGSTHHLRGWLAKTTVVVDLDSNTNYRVCGTDLGRRTS